VPDVIVGGLPVGGQREGLADEGSVLAGLGDDHSVRGLAVPVRKVGSYYIFTLNLDSLLLHSPTQQITKNNQKTKKK
jgi:hypothetical protein